MSSKGNPIVDKYRQDKIKKVYKKMQQCDRKDFLDPAAQKSPKRFYLRVKG